MATMKFIAGLRWDQISQQMFGDPNFYGYIIAKNIILVEDYVKAGGKIPIPLELEIPEIPEIDNELNELPPWRTEIS